MKTEAEQTIQREKQTEKEKRTRKQAENNKELNTKERTKEQREGITRGESPSNQIYSVLMSLDNQTT